MPHLLRSTGTALAIFLLSACGSEPAKTSGTARYASDGSLERATVAPGPHPNLVIVLVDTLRADAVWRPDGSAGDMRSFHELTKQGVYYSRAFAPSAWTDPSITSMLTGMSPREHRCIEPTRIPRIPKSVVTYVEVLRNAYGYETAVFSDSKWHRDQPWSIHHGFARGSASAGFAPQSRRPMERGFGFDVTESVLDDWLSARDATKPYCLLIHTFDPHDPYGARNRPIRTGDIDARKAAFLKEVSIFPTTDVRGGRAFSRAFLSNRAGRRRLSREHGRAFTETVVSYLCNLPDTPEDLAFADEMRQSYEQGLRWVDGQFGRAMQALRDRRLLDNTLLVITSDHGEAFGEHQSLGHGHHVHAELTRVPLFVMGPGPFAKGRVEDRVVSTYDVMPTFFALAGFELPEGVRGRPLQEASGSARVVASETVVNATMGGPGVDRVSLSRRTDRWSYLITLDASAGSVVERLYRADDHTEANDLAAGGRIATPLSALLRDAVARARADIRGEAIDRGLPAPSFEPLAAPRDQPAAGDR